jgi:F0F1-type ATP synthase membrane subunit b/b'
MNTTTLLWLAGVMLVLITFAQWVLLRSRYLDAITQQRARHSHQMQTAGQYMDQARKQIAQLQTDLTTARSQLARHAARAATAARERSTLAAAQPQRGEERPAARRGEPFDGFADTLPALQYPHDGALLTTYPGRQQ